MDLLRRALVTQILLLHVVWCHPNFQTLIPNGNRVPHPCIEGQTWLGVGHKYPAGGGVRNMFGIDFSKNGATWNTRICRADSDGDGRTNGEELGDPDCTWRPGKTPFRITNITHPGVCEPVDLPTCRQKNSWLKCMPGEFECEAFKDKDLQNLTLRLPPTHVPPHETTYSCMLFRVPDDTSRHLVAAQPILNNTSTVHHMLLFGCRDDGTLQESSEPYQCEMVPHVLCQEVIVAWTIGIQGDCIHQEAGFRLGKNGYKFVALQVHWNNPEKSSALMDSSGLIIHVTPNLRRYDAGILVFGHLYLQVDPVSTGDDDDDDGKTSKGGSGDAAKVYVNTTKSLQTYTSTCPRHCLTAMFPTSIRITQAINHMHHLGKAQRMELLRNGTFIRDLAVDLTYDYDSPVVHRLDPPVELHPGDEIRTTCVFRRPTSGLPVCYGDGTSDEMCFGFLTYFPLQPTLVQPWCTSRRSLISCERTLPEFWDNPIQGCRWKDFIRPPSKEAITIVKTVLLACYQDKQLRCSQRCRETLQETKKHPCFVGDIGFYIVSKIRAVGPEGVGFADAWFTCNCEEKFDYCERASPGGKQVLGTRQAKWCVDDDEGDPKPTSDSRTSSGASRIGTDSQTALTQGLTCLLTLLMSVLTMGSGAAVL